jgi:PPOX class probable F420-dependent enzyme
MPRMTEQERDAFLTEPGVLMRIATVRPDGGPHVTPIWFLYEEGAIYFTPRQKSDWFAHLRRDSRVMLCIDEQSLPYRKVLLEGRADLLYDIGRDDEWRDLYRRIARRYGPAEQAEAYIQATIDQPRGLYRLRLADAKLRTWRMPTGEEPAEGIWHRRYYAADSRLGG